jgi:hypothetical protein
MRAYLELLQMEVAAFHPLGLASQRLVSVALFLALYYGRPQLSADGC